ncbi:MAG: lipoprotein [Bacteriovoracaceae bacterium]|nr:lipoprotein [Bacteriovoracaceae bacterium]
MVFLFLILLSSCGVKGPPKMPAGSSVPSVEEEHPDLKLKPGTIFPNKAP